MNELIPLALQIIGGLGGQMLPEFIKMLGGDQAGKVASTIIDATKAAIGSADPAVVAAATSADKERALASIAAQTDQYRMQLADVADARTRDIDVRKIPGTNTRANVMLAGNFVCIVMLILVLSVYRNSMPDGIAAILGGLIGSLGTMLTQAFNFEFGSSRGNAATTDQLSGMIRNLK